MHYILDTEFDRRFANISSARKHAVESFAYWRDIGVPNPFITVYESNAVGKRKIGVIYKGRGYPVYETTDGVKYRISKDGNVRRLANKQKDWHPFGL